MNYKDIYYAPEFIKDFNRLTNKHKKIPEDFDLFLKIFLGSGNKPRSYHIPGMKGGCTGFSVFKVKKFHSEDLHSRRDCRIIYAERGDDIFFLEFYVKSNKENEDRKRICNSLKTVTDHTCEGRYVKKEHPNSRALLR